MNITSQIDRILSARRAAIPRVNQQIEQADSLIECLSRLSALATDLQIAGLPEVFQNAKDLIQEVSSTRSLLGSLKNRFGRDFLTIVTFGLAGTGKSRTLVTLTGLPDTELISRKGDHCTGTIIEVVPNTGAERSYSVKTFSKEDFFQERILPYFSSFGISTCPRTLDEFIAMKLPDLENAVKFIGKGNAASELQKGRYEQLLQIHSNLPSFQSDLTGESFPIEINEVPAWTTYPHEHDEAADWRCLAVRSMQLKTSIPLEDFQKVRLYDTPGLGSHRVGELDTLSKYIDDQADAVLRIDRPDPLRPRPERFDSELHDDIERQLTSGIKLADILTIVLNRLQDHAPNAEICDVEYQKAMKRGIPPGMIVVADCSQRDELHEEVIHPLLERLVRKCPEIDSRRINMLAGRLDEAAASLRQLLHEVETVVNAQMTQHDGEELFVGWFEKSQESLREELVRLKQEALSQHSEADSEFLEEIKRVTERARQEVLVPGPEEISEFQIRTRGRQLGGTIDHFTEQMRFQIAEICGEIRGELGREVIRSWQNRLRHALSHTGSLEGPRRT